MIQINIGDHAGSENGDAFTPIPTTKIHPRVESSRSQARWARRKAFAIARDIPSANAYFRSLSRGRSLTDLLNDNSIWINFNAGTTSFGFTYGNNDLWIGPLSFRIGRWTVLSTIIHELAHINGAGGAGNAAELALLRCGLGRRSEFRSGVDDPQTPYDPTITG